MIDNGGIYIMQSIGALVFVITLLLLLLWFLKRVQNQGWPSSKWNKFHSSKRLKIIEQLFIDQKRKLLLDEKDDTEYFILITADNAILLDNSDGSSFESLITNNDNNPKDKS